jgi:hypothetical protein
LDDRELNDRDLALVAQRLGGTAAERLDVEAVARGVLDRMNAAPHADGRAWLRPGWLRVAAALLVLLGGAMLARQAFQPSRQALAVIPTGDDLSGLSPAQLEALLAGLDQTLDAASQPDSADALEGLTEEQLRAVLQSLEG